MAKNGIDSGKTKALPEEDRKAFLLGALDQYEGRLTAYANRLLHGDLDQARDVVQFAFLKLCQQTIADVKPKLAAWLYTVVRNRIVDDIRAAKSSDQSLDFDCHDTKGRDPAEQAQRIEFLKQLRRLMIDLPESQREVIDLWSHGFSTNEIASITGTTPGTVRVNLHRGIKTLKQHPQVAKWLSGDTTEQPNSDSGSLKKPSRATGFSANPVGLGQSHSKTTSIEGSTESKPNGKHHSRVSMPGRLS